MAAVSAALSIFCFLVWRILWVTMVDNHEFAFSYNRLDGKIEVINRTGWIVRTPLVYTVHTIDLRPYQISITADIKMDIGGFDRSGNVGSRVLNAKLVRFNPAGLKTFLEWHGRKAGNNHDNMLEILKAYAFDVSQGKDCPFLTIESELGQKPSTNLQQVR